MSQPQDQKLPVQEAGVKPEKQTAVMDAVNVGSAFAKQRSVKFV